MQASAEERPWCLEGAPLTQASGFPTSQSSPAGAECGRHVVRVQKGEGAECREGRAREVGSGRHMKQGLARPLGIFKQGSLRVGSACSLEGGRQGWQQDQIERGGPT